MKVVIERFPKVIQLCFDHLQNISFDDTYFNGFLQNFRYLKIFCKINYIILTFIHKQTSRIR